MAVNAKYWRCTILHADNQTKVEYQSLFAVSPGDIVVVPSPSGEERVGLVLDAAPNEYERRGYRYILRFCSDEEPARLLRQREKAKTEKDKRFKTAGQLAKLAIKEALAQNGVGKEKIEASQGRIQSVLAPIQAQKEAELQKEANALVDCSLGLRLSADGKTVTGFARIRPKGKVILRIPSGVETIQDDALMRVKFDRLYIPKSLKCLGKYTLQNAKGEAKPISSIEVEEGNEQFFNDGTGFYSLEEGKKTLVRLLDHTLTTYTSPGDVTGFAEDAFACSPELKKIVVSEGAETFDEYALPDDTQVEEVFLPRTLKHFIPRGTTAYYNGERRAFFRVDEESENLFLDEDSLYEILEDGSYKLVTSQYDGKGIPLILEGTSVIGESAFRGKMEMETIDLPDSLRVIEEEAFCGSGLETLVVPEGVRQVGKRAFAWCNDLKRVQLYPNLEDIAEDAFEECAELRNIKTVGTRQVFMYENDIVKKRKGNGE